MPVMTVAGDVTASAAYAALWWGGMIVLAAVLLWVHLYNRKPPRQ